MEDLSDKRADDAFIEIARIIANFRNANTQYTDTEIAYALLGVCMCIDDTDIWYAFLHEALNECIAQEVMANN